MSQQSPASLFPLPNDVTPEEAGFYESVVVPRYSSLIAQGLVAEIPSGSRSRILDVGCGTGTPSLGILRRLGDGGQVVGVDPSGAMLDVARARALGELGRHVFYKREKAEQLKFGDEVFDVAVTNLTYANLSDYATALREMGRVVRAGGQIHIGEATDGTFSELTDVLRETLVQKDREDLVSRLDVMDALFPTGATLRAALEHAGFTGVRASTETFTIPFRNAEEALTDGLVASIYLDEMRKRTELETLIPDLLTHAAATLATYHSNGPLSFTVNATVVSALR